MSNTINARTLEGRRIVITRAPAQSLELVERLKNLGADAVSLPLVRFVEPEETAELDAAIRSLASFDWLMFTSANAVNFFLARCRALECWPSAERLQIAAVGSATRAALEKEKLRAVLVPREFSGAGLAAEVSGTVKGKAVLLPRSDRAMDELPLRLRNAGAKVMDVVAYRTAGAESFDPGAIASIRAGNVDAVTFFSPSAFREFQNLMGAEALAKWNSRVALAAVGPVTAEAIRAAGLQVTIEAEEATAASLVEALERHFAALAEAGRSR